MIESMVEGDNAAGVTDGDVRYRGFPRLEAGTTTTSFTEQAPQTHIGQIPVHNGLHRAWWRVAAVLTNPRSLDSRREYPVDAETDSWALQLLERVSSWTHPFGQNAC